MSKDKNTPNAVQWALWFDSRTLARPLLPAQARSSLLRGVSSIKIIQQHVGSRREPRNLFNFTSGVNSSPSIYSIASPVPVNSGDAELGDDDELQLEKLPPENSSKMWRGPREAKHLPVVLHAGDVERVPAYAASHLSVTA